MNKGEFSPKEFLRARRPERFSDSVVEESQGLDRSMLEYYLDTITNRSQEKKFENFARHLAEREICPNLLPQTGPIGGGDSKVDSETYPVADRLSLGWWVGIGREAANERWGFAFSAKKAWQGKVQSDIEKIVKTERGYKKAFFISNQFIPDKKRADEEDTLTKKHKIDVRIMDRTWILDRVFKNGHEALAIKDLELTIPTKKEIHKGPLDIGREKELEEVERRIAEALQKKRYTPQLAEDCIEAATLSRGLERPRTETDGKFDRAERICIKHGTVHQKLECVYQRAWTAFWWHEDIIEFNKFYESVEEYAKESRNSHELELLTNLWYILHSSVKTNELNETEAKYKNRTVTLKKSLERLGEEKNRPSTSLQAMTLLNQVHLVEKRSAGEPIDEILGKLESLVRSGEGLVGYPLEPLAKVLTEFSHHLEETPAYSQLFETIVEVISRRDGEISAARMLLKRGAQQLEADRPYRAIQSLGRALKRLYKHETRQESVHALYLCGCAYERIDLLWAARGTLLSAASLATDELWRYDQVTPLQAACFKRLKWLELQLGRLPQTLEWHRTDIAVRQALIDKGYDGNVIFKGNREYDLTLGALLLKTNFNELKWLSNLPDILEGLGLIGASTTLLYTLGYEEKIESEGFKNAFENEGLDTVFLKWRNHPDLSEMPDRLSLNNGIKVTLKSVILGCEIKVESTNESPCVELAETVLASIESLLSTSVVEKMVAQESKFIISIKKSDLAEDPFSFEIKEDTGRPEIEITCRDFDPHSMSLKKQGKIWGKILKLLITVTSRIIVIRDKTELDKLFREEMALDRSLGFTGSFVTIGNVLGYSPKTNISDWFNPETKEYPLKRAMPWDNDYREIELKKEKGDTKSEFKKGEGEPPKELLDMERTKHTQIETVSLIREKLWDEAGWCGTAFITVPDKSSLPVLAIIFKEDEPAKKIFSEWQKELGKIDKKEELRISIVRGINKDEPNSYRILIGSNPDTSFSRPNIRYAVMINRVHTMTPDSDYNLQIFLDSYQSLKGYYIVHGVAKEDMNQPKIIWELYIMKRELTVRHAWQISRNDIDSAAILEDDDPIIPDGNKNAPVKELLRWQRKSS